MTLKPVANYVDRPVLTNSIRPAAPSIRDCNQVKEGGSPESLKEGVAPESLSSWPGLSHRAGPGCLHRIPRRLSGLLPGLVLCDFARWA